MRGILQKAYEDFWVPVFGRILMKLASIIEGKDLKNEKPTFNLKSTNEQKLNKTSMNKN